VWQEGGRVMKYLTDEQRTLEVCTAMEVE
jgi:hypothetical protein